MFGKLADVTVTVTFLMKFQSVLCSHGDLDTTNKLKQNKFRNFKFLIMQIQIL